MELSKPLVVDLDGTLIRTDLLYETFVRAFFAKPWIILLIPFWLMLGRVQLKKRIFRAGGLEPSDVPLNDELIDYLGEQYHQGRDIVLCTGSWHEAAEKVAMKFTFFSSVFGSNGTINLTGKTKAQFLVDLYGQQGFTYIGNEVKDLEIWKYAKSAIVVGGSPQLLSKVRKFCDVEKEISETSSKLRVILKQIRVHQWTKNLLIFVPLITSHQAGSMSHLFASITAFVSLSLCASATYILNDLSDLDSDRKHATKKYRPLASGDISISKGMIFAGALFLGSFILASQLPAWFTWSLVLYVCITLSYSFKFKKMQTIDIIILATLYTLRIISGALAVEITPSFWLLTFSMFAFLCLALIKRISEIIKNLDSDSDSVSLVGRGYYVTDLSVLLNLAASSGIVSILVFSMYINSPDVINLYAHPHFLWLICPLFGYWVIRVIVMASRGQIDEDPIVFAIKDWRSWIAAALALIIIFLASNDRSI